MTNSVWSIAAVSSLVILMFLSRTGCAQVYLSCYGDQSTQQNQQSIIKQRFSSFQGKLNLGLSPGTYWIKAENSGEPAVLEINSARITVTKAFINQQSVSRTIDQGFHSYPVGSQQTLYIKVICQKEAFIPIQVYPQTRYLSHLRDQHLIFGLYYGFAIMVMIFNLFYFFTFGDKTFLLYTLTLITITMSFFYSDGLFYKFGNIPWLVRDGDMIFHFGLIVIGSAFTATFLEYHLHLPKMKYALAVFIGFTAVGYGIYLVNDNPHWFIMADTIVVSTLVVFWVSAVWLSKRSSFARFFVVAYGFLLFMTIDFYVAPAWGLPNIGINTNLVKIGGVCEMLVLSYAVMFRMKALRRENDKLKSAIFDYTSEISQLEEQFIKLKQGKENTISQAKLNLREIEIISLISQAKTNQEIADELFISVNTVKYHIKHLYKKLEISSRQEARIKATEIQAKVPR